jgi:hypothetical protein
MLKAWQDWCKFVLNTENVIELADIMDGLVMSITSASRQRSFVCLGLIPMLLQLLQALTNKIYSSHYQYKTRKELQGMRNSSSKMMLSVLAVVSRMCESLTDVDINEITVQEAIARSDLLPLIISLCSANTHPAPELELPTRILWFLSRRCSMLLHAQGVPAVMCRLLHVSDEGTLTNAVLCIGNMACCSQDSMMAAIEDADAVTAMVSLLRSRSADVQEWTCWSIRQLLRRLHRPILAKLCIYTDVISALLPLTRSDNAHLCRQARSTLCTLVISGCTDGDATQAFHGGKLMQTTAYRCQHAD